MIWISLSRWWMYTAQIFSRNYRMMEMKIKGAEFSSTKKSTRKRKMDGSLLTVKRDHTSEWKRHEETLQELASQRTAWKKEEDDGFGAYSKHFEGVCSPPHYAKKKPAAHHTKPAAATCFCSANSCHNCGIEFCRHRRTWLGVAVSQTPQ
jgi:hypothetical protein